jgi:WD40 repeat protein
LHSDLKFSPNGKLLASSSWDRTTSIWNTPSDANMPMNPVCNLSAPGHIFQVSWSSDASLLITRTIRTVNIWKVVRELSCAFYGFPMRPQNGEKQATIGSRRNIRHVMWLSDTKGEVLCRTRLVS